MPRIAIIRQKYTAFGGAERFTERVMRALIAGGTEVSLITRKWKANAGESPYQIIERDPFAIGRRWRDAAFHKAACDAVAEHEFDLVQSHERLSCCDIFRAGDGVHASWLEQRAQVRSPWERRLDALSPYHRYVLAQERAMFRSERLKTVICNSRVIADELRERFDMPEEKIEVIYSGVDTQRFHPSASATHREPVRTRLGIPQDDPVLLFVGSGFERKGLMTAMQAIAMGRTDTHLIVVGKDRHAARYEQTANDIIGAQRVHFLGPQADVLPYYAAADLLILPTLYDPFPNVALEAFACGLPVITSTKSGASDLIENDKNGFVCNALAWGTMEEVIDEFCSRLSTSDDLRIAARHSVEHLTPEFMEQNLSRLYARLLNQ